MVKYIHTMEYYTTFKIVIDLFINIFMISKERNSKRQENDFLTCF